MKVDGYGNIKNNAPVKRRGVSGSGGSFADVLSAADSADGFWASATSELSATAPLSDLLALQEVSGEEQRRSQQIQQGHNLLDALEQLRRHLLLGSLPLSTLQNLEAHLARTREHVSDPKLISIIDDIELRAAVELAKLEVAMARNNT